MVWGIMAAVSSLGLTARYRSYDDRGLSTSRERALASIIEEALSRGMGVIALVPQPLAAGLASHLGYEALSRVEEAPRVEVSLRFDNRLYLPSKAPRGVELAGKKNSRASYERVVKLESLARRRGIEVYSHRFLSSHREVVDYVTSYGVAGVSERVPVTKAALYILAISRCYSIEGLEEVTIDDEAGHTVYLVNVDEIIVEGVYEALRRAVSSTGFISIPQPLRAAMARGLEGELEYISRRLGLKALF